MQEELKLFSDGVATIEVEEWKTVVGFARYECSSFGRFRNRVTGKYATGTVANNGYVHIGLMKDGVQMTKLAHRLIAETFLERPSTKHTDVNHKNKRRGENRVSNLEWSTRSQNSTHARRKP